MKKENFQNLSADELIQKKTALKEELYKINYQRRAGNVDKPHLFSKNRKDIARIETILQQQKGKVLDERN